MRMRAYLSQDIVFPYYTYFQELISSLNRFIPWPVILSWINPSYSTKYITRINQGMAWIQQIYYG